MSVIIFVYGSLRTGLGNHFRIDKSEFLGEFRIPGFKMYRICSSYPAVIYEPTYESTIVIEAYKITEEKLAELDHLEGHPNFYQRIEVYCAELKTNGWIYCRMNEHERKSVEKTPLIENGDWIDHLGKKLNF